MPEELKNFLLVMAEFAAVLIIGYIIIKIIMKIEKRMLAKSKLDTALHTFVINGTRIVLLVIYMIVLMATLKISAAPFVTMLAACGAAIALALKDSLGNVAGGMLIIINKPFKKNDVIELDGVSGTVEKIDLLFTDLKSFDNKLVRMPNGLINTAILINYTNQITRRVDCSFGISYDADILHTKKILEEVANSCEKILKDKDYIIGVASQQESCVLLDLKVWCLTEDYFAVKYYLEETVKLAFDKEGIPIPFPQLDVHLKNS